MWYSKCQQIFVAAVISAVIYSLIYLVLRGTLVIKGGLKLNLDPHLRWNGRYASEEYHRFIHAIAKSMLWYVQQPGFVGARC